MDKPGILWIIGAGASKHVGMPLLNDFRPFFQGMWDRYRINRKLLRDVLPKAMEIMDAHPTQNIEALLLPSSRLRNDERDVLKQAIRRTFERRQLGRLGQWVGPRFGKGERKFAAYSRLLCCMQDGDVVISFNYDNSLEYVLACNENDFELINLVELPEKRLRALRQQGRNKWIPPECFEPLSDLRLSYAPTTVFGDSRHAIGSGAKVVSLMKIHGSINWFSDGADRIQVGSPPETTSVPLLAYPEPNKPETRRPPLSHIINEAIKAVSSLERVVIIGYSFPPSDAEGHPLVEHLVDQIPSKSVLAIDPYPGDSIRTFLRRAKNGLVADELFEQAFNSTKFDGDDLTTYVTRMRESSL